MSEQDFRSSIERARALLPNQIAAKTRARQQQIAQIIAAGQERMTILSQGNATALYAQNTFQLWDGTIFKITFWAISGQAEITSPDGNMLELVNWDRIAPEDFWESTAVTNAIAQATDGQ